MKHDGSIRFHRELPAKWWSEADLDHAKPTTCAFIFAAIHIAAANSMQQLQSHFNAEHLRVRHGCELS
jgi:hypothetical protein